MFSTLRNRFGIPGVISVIALVFAMLGGAYAASSGGSDNGATASAKKSAKGPRGPRGPKGATGAAGPAGPTGPAGAKGDTGAAGAAGEKGATGSAGASGKSVATGILNAGQGGCIEGGAYVEVSGEAATKKSVCNGEPGAPGNTGAEGSPWTVGGTLPAGESLLGTFAAPTKESGTEEGIGVASISFPIPLASPIVSSNIHFFRGGLDPTPTGCTFDANLTVQAEPGHLCIVSEPLVSVTSTSDLVGIGTSAVYGAFIKATSTNPGSVAKGQWAVTAPTS